MTQTFLENDCAQCTRTRHRMSCHALRKRLPKIMCRRLCESIIASVYLESRQSPSTDSVFKGASVPASGCLCARMSLSLHARTHGGATRMRSCKHPLLFGVVALFVFHCGHERSSAFVSGNGISTETSTPTPLRRRLQTVMQRQVIAGRTVSAMNISISNQQGVRVRVTSVGQRWTNHTLQLVLC